jgi:hypothetical protein
MANRMDDVDSLHVEIDNLNNLLVGFYFIRDARRICCALQRASL